MCDVSCFEMAAQQHPVLPGIAGQALVQHLQRVIQSQQVNGQNPGSLGVISLPTVVGGHKARVVCSGSPGQSSSQAAVNVQVQTSQSTPRAVERTTFRTQGHGRDRGMTTVTSCT